MGCVPADPAIAAFAPDSVAVAIKLSSLDLHPAEYYIRGGWCQTMIVPLLHVFFKNPVKAMFSLDSCPILTPNYAILKGSLPLGHTFKASDLIVI